MYRGFNSFTQVGMNDGFVCKLFCVDMVDIVGEQAGLIGFD